MTTARQIKKLLGRFVEQHEDLVLRGPWIFLKPIRHLLRGVLIDRTGSGTHFSPRWAVVNLCEPNDTFPLNWGGIIAGRDGFWWKWSNPDLQAELLAAIEAQALPELRAIRTLEDFVAFASSEERFRNRPFQAFPQFKIRVDAALGDLESARAICRKFEHRPQDSSRRLAMDNEFEPIASTLCPLLAGNDRHGMAQLLHKWERYTVGKLKIEDLYEPTPFPLEVS